MSGEYLLEISNTTMITRREYSLHLDADGCKIIVRRWNEDGGGQGEITMPVKLRELCAALEDLGATGDVIKMLALRNIDELHRLESALSNPLKRES